MMMMMMMMMMIMIPIDLTLAGIVILVNDAVAKASPSDVVSVSNNKCNGDYDDSDDDDDTNRFDTSRNNKSRQLTTITDFCANTSNTISYYY